jgi:penicillin amidase
MLNPDEGFFATANQAVIGAAYAHTITSDWDMGYRSQRIYDLLGEKDQFSIEDFTALQVDDLNNFAETLTPYLLGIDADGGRYYAAGQRLLREWDFHQPADSPAAAYYNAAWRHLLALTFHDELPESLWPDGGGRWFEVVRPLLEDPHADWWDDVTTEDLRESRNDILKAALADARDELTHLQARRAADWTWGHQHLLNLENQTLGQSDIGLVRRLLNRGGYEVGGGESTVNATGWTASAGYEIDWAPSMRMVVSLADFDDSRWINLTGVSGHAFHPNYVDQTELWVEGRTLPWAFGAEAVDAAGENTLRLLPAD